MACHCHLATLESQFNDRIAQRDLADYREHGPGATTRAILDLVGGLDLRDATLLDVGSGIGALPCELFTAGLASATAIEPSAAYLGAARQEAERRGLAARIVFRHGDLQTIVEAVEPADLVTLDRVICCDPHMETLVRAAATRSRRWLAASFPNDRWYIRVGMRVENVGRALRRSAFRSYVHPVPRIDASLAAGGLKRVRTLKTFVWQIALYERAPFPDGHRVG